MYTLYISSWPVFRVRQSTRTCPASFHGLVFTCHFVKKIIIITHCRSCVIVFIFYGGFCSSWFVFNVQVLYALVLRGFPQQWFWASCRDRLVQPVLSLSVVRYLFFPGRFGCSGRLGVSIHFCTWGLVVRVLLFPVFKFHSSLFITNANIISSGLIALMFDVCASWLCCGWSGSMVIALSLFRVSCSVIHSIFRFLACQRPMCSCLRRVEVAL